MLKWQKEKQETQTIWSNNNHTVKYNNFNIFIFNVLCQSSATSVMYHYLLHFRASEKQCSTTSWLARSSGQQYSALLLLVRIRIFHHFINDDTNLLWRNSNTGESTWEKPFYFDLAELDDVDDLLGGTGIERYWNHRNLPICTSCKNSFLLSRVRLLKTNALKCRHDLKLLLKEETDEPIPDEIYDNVTVDLPLAYERVSPWHQINCKTSNLISPSILVLQMTYPRSKCLENRYLMSSKFLWSAV